MNMKYLRELEEILHGVEYEPSKVDKASNDHRVKKCLNGLFDGVEEVKFSFVFNISENDLVSNLVYNYARDNVKIIEDDEKDNVSNGNIVGQYLQEAAYFPLLSKDDERKYATMLKRGTKEEKKIGREKLIVHNLRLVISIASRYTGRGVELGDLIQEGNSGLMTAIDKFDVDLGYALSTYATWWIKQAITRSIANDHRTIRIPVHQSENIDSIKKIEKEYMSKFHKEPSINELADFMAKEKADLFITDNIKKIIEDSSKLPKSKRKHYESLSPAKKKKDKDYDLNKVIIRDGIEYDLNFREDIKNYKHEFCYKLIARAIEDNSNIVSLNKLVGSDQGEESGDELLDFVSDGRLANNPSVSCENEDMINIVQNMLTDPEIISDREREILRLRYGVATIEPMTDEQISKLYEIKDVRSSEQVLKDIEETLNIVENNPEEEQYIKEYNLNDSKLNDYQMTLFELKFSIPPAGGRTLEQVGEIFKVTKERIRQIENRAENKLGRNKKYKVKVKDYVK